MQNQEGMLIYPDRLFLMLFVQNLIGKIGYHTHFFL